MTPRVPFAERGGALRGLLDLATGCYPAFLFGGSCKASLPVFHFHEVTRDWLEPRLQYLAENRYRSVTCDEISRLVIDGVSPGPRTVGLTFDDAWTSMWTVAMPLLRRFGFRAIVFAIPGRVSEAAGVRPTIDDVGRTRVLRHENTEVLRHEDTTVRRHEDTAVPRHEDTAVPRHEDMRTDGPPFATWPELRAMHDSGVVDIQSHTRSHAMIFGHDAVSDFVTPDYEREPMLNRPLTSEVGGAFLGPDALGMPLYLRQSRMSDARRFLPDQSAAERCRAHVARHGGRAFFDRPGWRTELETIAHTGRGHFEDDDTRVAVIREELAEGRAMLNDKLRTTAVRHVALPWGIAGDIARRAVAETGHGIAFAERPLRKRLVRAGDDRYGLMRLNGKFLTCLPGRGGRQWFMTTVANG